MSYQARDARYEVADGWFRRCGQSGLMLPAISLGCWHNFGGVGTDSLHHGDDAGLHENARKMLLTAFDHGITHFDLANNYGPPPGSAETRVGRILQEDLAAYRDELIISTKAGYRMGPGPYGEWGSRKYLLSSLDQSLKRLRLDYVDIFYHHRPDADTPLEETMGALDQAVRSGKALYAGISNYSAQRTCQALETCRDGNLTCPIIHQPSYNLLYRQPEEELLPTADELGIGVIAFCPLAQGRLTDKYLQGIPDDSRASVKGSFLRPDQITEAQRQQVLALNKIAVARGQSLAQMALSWVLRHPRVTSALIGASRPAQILENVKAAEKLHFEDAELAAIDQVLAIG